MCVCVCVCVCARECVRAYVCVCAHARACVFIIRPSVTVDDDNLGEAWAGKVSAKVTPFPSLRLRGSDLASATSSCLLLKQQKKQSAADARAKIHNSPQ